MSPIGPSLPPELSQKRKRDEGETGPKRPAPRSRSASSSSSSSNGSGEKRRRVLGPSLPPPVAAALDERASFESPPQEKKEPKEAPKAQNNNANDNGSDSDSDSDDFGPSLPPAGGGRTRDDGHDDGGHFAGLLSTDETGAADEKPKREDWMLVPPSELDWGSRVDPTKLKNRKFNTGRGAKGPSRSGGGGDGGENTLWTETPEQRRKRLEDEVMGVKKPAQNADDGAAPRKSKRDEAGERSTDRRIREYNVRNGEDGNRARARPRPKHLSSV